MEDILSNQKLTEQENKHLKKFYSDDWLLLIISFISLVCLLCQLHWNSCSISINNSPKTECCACHWLSIIPSCLSSSSTIWNLCVEALFLNWHKVFRFFAWLILGRLIRFHKSLPSTARINRKVLTMSGPTTQHSGVVTPFEKKNYKCTTVEDRIENI